VVVDTGPDITGVSDDSRTVAAGDLFFCIRGATFDGHDAAPDAVSRGAVAVVVDHRLDLPDDVVQVVVTDVRSVIGHMASRALGDPASRLRVVGVTGTNGKTSTVSFIGSLLRGLGCPTVTIGTLTGARTTPEAIDLQGQLADAVESGATHAVMEVSSHALVMGRVNGILFDVAAFSNLSRDHLDFHGSMEEYFAAKRRLFDAAMARAAVVNVDDEWGDALAASLGIPVVRCTAGALTDVRVGVDRVSFGWRGHPVVVGAGGSFAVTNSCLALDVVAALGFPEDDVARASSSIRPVEGRFEVVPTGSGFSVIVDYAHTPEALRTVLSSARALTTGRLVVVFGCGGGRDRGKRAEMGRAVGEIADAAFVTSDNPRFEDPESIINEVLAGMVGTGCDVVSIVDRAIAIESAISGAGSDDIVVIAGKGHEPYQEVAGEFLAFSDVEVARNAVARRSGSR
jgi:UDP-N-acetylmuramoyl-L-alanyl-D-glutamate--2,6-diaminopimelate ligase